MTYPFHEEVQKYFPGFDYKNPSGDRSVLCDMRNPGNMVGHQQRAFSVHWALKTCSPTDLGLDLGSPRGLTPYCVHVDIFGNGRSHPFYGGGRYLSDVVYDAARAPEIFPQDTFPFISSNHSLEHMAASGDDGIVSLLHGWLALLRQGGILAMIVPDNDHFDVMKSDKDHRHAWGARDFRPRVLDKLLAQNTSELLDYNTLQNHFSFDVVLRKR